jgi:D-alanyl-D-alanine carboxypeptidase
MNQRAAELGCTDTRFVNPHGLYAEGQYTTARDLSIIAKHAMSLPGFMEIASTYTTDIGPSNKHDSLNLWSTIKLMSKNSEYII